MRAYNILVAAVFVGLAFETLNAAYGDYQFGLRETNQVAQYNKAVDQWLATGKGQSPGGFTYVGPTGWPFNFYYPCPNQDSWNCGSGYGDPTSSIVVLGLLGIGFSFAVYAQFLLSQTRDALDRVGSFIWKQLEKEVA